MSVFYETNAFGDKICMKIGVGLIVFILLVGRLAINYKTEVDKYYKDKIK
ncbi:MULTISPECIES: hypothetical protein [Bacillus cereus group]|nr:hypothetical protein [Bacillus cereus]HDR7981204.1 hypothetical protein [Bacillus cereus]HDR8059539.1 hypothetical protein [Bacillus cereus]HDR8221008.1 hypothetical protein [Bacillus cereus]HDR8229422.1 hypothetical protein [Bacillus cereus]HDR8417993.1 hypothetical protein [Bacillus cereus]